MERLNLPDSVELILDRLSNRGFDAYVVGGCVRDSIMGIPPHDWDICTSALPEQIIEVFSGFKVIPTGLQHGTVTVVIDHQEFEITTYRLDGEYKDNRRPESVEFVQDLKLDLMRRDFTINALAYNHESVIVDYFNGIGDIKDQIIRCVGNPYDRFSEDALRIVRAVRFAIRYGFKIERDTRNSLVLHRMSLMNISSERICQELNKIIACDLHGKSTLIHELITILEYIVPEFGRVKTWEICDRLANSESQYDLRLALLFDFDNSDVEPVLKKLRFSNQTIKNVTTINKYGRRIRDVHDWLPDKKSIANKEYHKSDYYERKLLHDIRYNLAVLSVKYAKAYAVEDENESAMLELLESRVAYALRNREPYELSDLAVDGNDLMRIGFSGKSIGLTLNALLDMVMRDVDLNRYDNLIEIAKSIKEHLLCFAATAEY